MSDATIIIKVDNDLKTDFATAAKAADRTTSQLLRDYMRHFVEQTKHDAWLEEKVNVARQDYKNGDYKPNEEVQAFFATKRTVSSSKKGIQK